MQDAMVILLVAVAVGVVTMALSALGRRMSAVEGRAATLEGQAKDALGRLGQLEKRDKVRIEWPARPPRSAVYQVVAPRLPTLPRAPGFDDGDDGEPTLDEASAGEVKP